MPRYFKGDRKSDGMSAYAQIYDKPVTLPFGDDSDMCIGQVRCLTLQGVDHVATMEELLEKYSLTREIGKMEYDFYEDMISLMTDIYMSGYSGGFPRKENCEFKSRKIRSSMPRLLEDINRIIDNGNIIVE